MPSVLQIYFALSLIHLYIHLLGEWSSTVTSPTAGVCHSRQLTVPRWAKCIATSFGVRWEGCWQLMHGWVYFGQTCVSESLSVSSFICLCIWSIVAGLAGQSSCAELCKHMCLTPFHPTSCRLVHRVQVHPCILCCSERGRDGPLRLVSANFKVTPLLHMLNAHTRVHLTTL